MTDKKIKAEALKEAANALRGTFDHTVGSLQIAEWLEDRAEKIAQPLPTTLGTRISCVIGTAHFSYENVVLTGKGWVDIKTGSVLSMTNVHSWKLIDPAKGDERVSSWEKLVNHPIWESCFEKDGPLLPNMIEKLDEYHTYKLLNLTELTELLVKVARHTNNKYAFADRPSTHWVTSFRRSFVEEITKNRA